ncbi:hypothetical protein HRG_007959 [Hirsutella rhossiliensis]|uniref:Uncharacterized protein n=1 Tax=Hirsutella rhossiliensis TaxID=111463 RepID=A0A9P8MV46_9HYPO|nr:uncharacterized protein HRG_07959 [Hirsutella rhossiliensis]KAH0960806.1 hypothetical protein HRG_07959 [Hirsutella rhossiliensis]
MDPEADEAAMSQMLGFSSFGMQDRPLKKRRHDVGADAFMTDAHGGGGASNPPAPSQQPSHGAAGRQPANADEISLDDDDDHNDGAAPGATVPESGPSGGVMSSRPAGLPDRPPPGTGFTGSPFNRHQPQQGGQHQHGRHFDDPSRGPWYEGYYDPDSNQNPWKKLEKARGLQTRGSWNLCDLRTTAAASDAT